MVKKKVVLVLLVLVFCVQGVFALTANSTSYSVSMFGGGMVTANPSSTSYNATILSEAKGTTRNAGSDLYTANIGYSISPSSAVVGSTIGLYISALNYEAVWARITSPNAQVQVINLVNGGTVNYVPSPSVVGTYEVSFMPIVLLGLFLVLWIILS